MPDSKPLLDRRILIVEDEYFIADDMRLVVEGAGGIVVGPFADLNEDVFSHAGTAVDAAVLDINVKGTLSFDLADHLRRRGVPFCFATGYDAEILPERFSQVLRIEKPFDGPELIKELVLFCGQAAPLP